jgi:hypothetical protein
VAVPEQDERLPAVDAAEVREGRGVLGEVAVLEESGMSNEYTFDAPFIHVWLPEPVRGGVLQNARLQQIGDRTFIVGTLVITGKADDARDGLTMWIPVDSVLAMTEYQERGRVDAVLAQRARSTEKKRGWWR